MPADLAPVQDAGQGRVVTESGDPAGEHVLRLGDAEFKCGPRLPMGVFLKFADSDSDMVTFHHVLRKLVPDDQHDAMWDACDELEPEDVFKAIGELISSYSERPTGSASRSSGGSGRGKRS